MNFIVGEASENCDLTNDLVNWKCSNAVLSLPDSANNLGKKSGKLFLGSNEIRVARVDCDDSASARLA